MGGEASSSLGCSRNRKNGQCSWNVLREWRWKEMKSGVKFKIFNNLVRASCTQRGFPSCKGPSHLLDEHLE